MANKASVALLLEDEPLMSLDIELALESAGFDVASHGRTVSFQEIQKAGGMAEWGRETDGRISG